MIRRPPISTRTDTLFPAPTRLRSMCVSVVETVCSRLIDHGRAAATPFALIENGTRTNQRVVTGPLSELAVRARAHDVRAPALLVIGEVAAFADTLAWFGATPLSAPALEQAA